MANVNCYSALRAPDADGCRAEVYSGNPARSLRAKTGWSRIGRGHRDDPMRATKSEEADLLAPLVNVTAMVCGSFAIRVRRWPRH